MAYDFQLEQQEIEDFNADMLELGAIDFENWVSLMEETSGDEE